jgi:hypothetical protein
MAAKRNKNAKPATIFFKKKKKKKRANLSISTSLLFVHELVPCSQRGRGAVAAQCH